jgi:uncharacterized protein with PIN domain
VPIDDKPSKNEQEYFLLRDAEWLKERRALLDAERQSREASPGASPTGMRCPRCDGTLVSRAFHHVMIDVCPKCNGVWLDNGELEMLGAVSSAEYAGLVRSLANA